MFYTFNHLSVDEEPPKKRYKPRKGFRIPHMANPKRNEYVGDTNYK